MKALVVLAALLGAFKLYGAPLDYAQSLAEQGDCYRALSEVFRAEFDQGETQASLEIKLPCLAERGRWDRFDPALDRGLNLWQTPKKQQWALKGMEHAWKRGDEQRAQLLYTNHLSDQTPPPPSEPQGAKSPHVATALQAVLPGAGLAYAGRWGPAAASFGLNGLFLYGTAKAWNQGQNALAALLFFFEWGWYFGGIEAAREAVTEYNRRLLVQDRQVWLKVYGQRF